MGYLRRIMVIYRSECGQGRWIWLVAYPSWVYLVVDCSLSVLALWGSLKSIDLTMKCHGRCAHYIPDAPEGAWPVPIQSVQGRLAGGAGHRRLLTSAVGTGDDALCRELGFLLLCSMDSLSRTLRHGLVVHPNGCLRGVLCSPTTVDVLWVEVDPGSCVLTTSWFKPALQVRLPDHLKRGFAATSVDLVIMEASLIVSSGIEINDDGLARFVEHVDKDNNGIITFEEWRDFLLLYPHEATIENIYHHWERVCLIDIGEHAVIPEGISKHMNASRYLIAGGLAGAASRTATAPLDRLKVVMQVKTTKTCILPAIKDILKEGHFLGFFRGNGLNVVKVTPESALKFYTFEMLKDVIVNLKGEDKSDIGASGRLIAGGLAGAVAQTAIYPIDLIKTRLQTFACEGGKVPSLGKLSKDIWVQEGPRAFYRGLIPSLLGIIPYAGIDLAAYETLKDFAATHITKDNEPGPLVQLGCGTISGTLGATCVYPLQVVRTRMQAQRTNTDAAYRGMADVFQRTYRHEGFLGFYKGIFPNLLKVVPAASITYIVYEAMKKSFALN
ncbi:hypothetical protein Taro_007491 [Colocasia esculenta]|uniref:EF-hand domain-containing protein n=1 Tax=Colocasia esculenta TaxID=4460 RepID=A0A843TU99_COLES|nr:hypothetical protein [Colocasia esculenta]